jgi:putative membrane protein
VGRIVPELTEGRAWPYVTVGAGYAVLGIAMIAYASRRQQEVEAALAAGEPATIDGRVLRWLTGLGIGLAVATLVVVLAQP